MTWVILVTSGDYPNAVLSIRDSKVVFESDIDVARRYPNEDKARTSASLVETQAYGYSVSGVRVARFDRLTEFLATSSSRYPGD